jgi:Amt family ammonium transporter
MSIGPRKGFPTTAMPPHNLAITACGAGMLWVGWFGFNGGSALAANGDAAMAVLVTHISACGGVLSWSTLEWIKFGKPSLLGAVTGMVAGLGTITAASGYVGPGGALVMGLIAGFVCFNATQYIKRVLQIDDSLDVMPTHGVGGIIGTLMAGVFASTGLGAFSGYGYAEGMDSMGSQLGVQAIGVTATVVFTAAVTWCILKLVDALVGLRVEEEQEVQGLDISQHEETGYNL